MLVSQDPIQQAFIDYERDVARVPKAQNDDAKEVHPLIRDAIKKALPDNFDRAFLAGSYGRRTQAKSLKDVDLVVVLKDVPSEWEADCKKAMTAVQEAAKTSGLIKWSQPRVRAVQCTLHDYDFMFDVVPALPPAFGDGLRLACNSTEFFEQWSLEDPEAQLKACTDKNKATGGIYVPGTRIVKSWNERVNGSKDKKPLKSYHVESILYHAISKELTYLEMVQAFFAEAQRRLQPFSRTSVPGQPLKFVDDRLKQEKRAEALKLVNTAADLVEQAAATDDTDEAAELLAEVFGTGFKAPSTSKSALSRALAGAGAGISGSGLVIPSASARSIPTGRSWRP